MIFTMGQCLWRESSSDGEGKGEEGHHHCLSENAMKGLDERGNARYPAIYTIERGSGDRL
jgi:hypothetical protein